MHELQAHDLECLGSDIKAGSKEEALYQEGCLHQGQGWHSHHIPSYRKSDKNLGVAYALMTRASIYICIYIRTVLRPTVSGLLCQAAEGKLIRRDNVAPKE